jgi:hypothetical protein
MNRDELILALQQRYPKATFKPSEEFFSDKNNEGIWVPAYNPEELCSGKPLFDYYSQDSGSKKYTRGVHNSLHNWLNKNGWYCEFYDPGTVIIWEI